MEKWQLDYITKNLPVLIRSIYCNETLLAHLRQVGNLTDEEVQEANAAGFGDQKTKKASQLLSILCTKVGAYEHLTKSLFKCKQTGAVLILLQGIQHNVRNASPFEFCRIELNTEEILSKNVLFEGVSVPLKAICGTSNPTRLQKLIASGVDALCYEQLLKGNPITIAKATIPEPLSYYIPRTLYVSAQLDPVVFAKLDSDVFCIEGIELHQLSDLASQITNTSSGRNSITVERSINQTHRLTTRFILLENHEHFQKISAKTDKVVHWIKHRRGSYIYVKSSRGNSLRKVQQYVSHDNPDKLSEDEFTQNCLDCPTNSPVLLYDSPGMGKTVLLAELARKVKEKRPDRNVMFFKLPDFINNLPSPGLKCTSSELKLHLTKLVTSNNLGRSVIQNLMDCDNHRVELFLDAYDELPETDVVAANNILECISRDCKNIRMWITTRPHRRHELEKKFGILGYNILPFTEGNKNSFFLKYWQDQYGIMETDQVNLFADKCLKIISETMSSHESDIAGIPLQCKMLADIFAEDAKSGNQICTEPHLQYNSIFQMYAKFMNTKFSNLNTDNIMRELKDFHVKTAFRTIFSKEIILEHENISMADMKAVYRLGILEPSKSDPNGITFVHRTFAEFLVSEHFVTSGCLTADLPQTSVEKMGDDMDLLFGNSLATLPYVEVFGYKYLFQPQVIAYSFIHPVVVKFLQFFLSNVHSAGNDFKHLKGFHRESKYYTPQALYVLLFASLKIDAVDLFTFLLNTYFDFEESGDNSGKSETLYYPLRFREGGEKEQTFVQDAREWNDSKWFVSVAAKYSSLELVKLSCNFAESVSRRKWHEVDYERYDSPLRVSLRRGHYQIFEYLHNYNREEFYKEPLMHWCLEESYKNSAEVIADKVQIVKRILHQEPDQLNHPHPSYFDYVPILAPDIHFKLVKCLVEAGAQLTLTDRYGSNFAHKAALHFSADEYHELVQWTISCRANEIFKQGDCNRVTPVHCALQRIELKTEALELLAKECGIDFNDNDNKDGKSEFAYAGECGRSERVQNDILRLGGNKNKKYRQSLEG